MITTTTVSTPSTVLGRRTRDQANGPRSNLVEDLQAEDRARDAENKRHKIWAGEVSTNVGLNLENDTIIKKLSQVRNFIMDCIVSC